jgi:hypothetical protein
LEETQLVMPTGAVVVILLLKGVQIVMPGPAFFEAGKVWAPARAVLQDLGYTTQWQPAGGVLAVKGFGHSALFPLKGAPKLDEQALPAGMGARRVGGTIYLSAAAFKRLGVVIRWVPQDKRIEIDPPFTRSERLTLAAILADPPGMVARAVQVEGEYLGWSAYAGSWATRNGPPCHVGDWVLRNEQGAIYCSAAPVRPSATTALPFTLTPYEPLGRRVRVAGTIRLARGGWPYLEYRNLQALSGVAGMICQLQLDQTRYRPGERMVLRLRVANPQGSPVRVVFPSVGGEIVVAAPGPRIYTVKQTWEALVAGRSDLTLAPGEERTWTGGWTLPAEARAGRYTVTVKVAPGLTTMPLTCDVVTD